MTKRRPTGKSASGGRRGAGITVNKALAKQIIYREAKRAAEPGDDRWVSLVRRLSVACNDCGIQTHIAFIGTAILAKATHPAVDVYAVKRRAQSHNAYSARSVVSVLAPAAIHLNFSIGVTGREPLNNQPYFAIDRVERNDLLARTKGGAIDAVSLVCDILDELAQARTSAGACSALRAFVSVRREYTASYPIAPAGAAARSVEELLKKIEALSRNSEGGRLAQAIAAGVLDMVSGRRRVISGAVNDPDRRTIGDISVRSRLKTSEWERVFEVRDKSVDTDDLIMFANKSALGSAEKAAVLAVSTSQQEVDASHAQSWARTHGVALTVFHGWRSFVHQAVFWSPFSDRVAARRMTRTIRARLIDIEASREAIQIWDAS